jgi:hypothetical protein
MSILKVGGYIFSDFLLVGTKNQDLSQIRFGQKIPKASIVVPIV